MNWLDTNDVVELEGRHNAGHGVHLHWKFLRINSELHWVVYKETVAESLDKSIELFATKKVDACVKLDLNRCASPIDGSSQPLMNQNEVMEPTLTQQYEVRKSLSPIRNDDYWDDEYEADDHGVDLHDNHVGDLDTYNEQETLEHDIPYSRCYASDSDDDGPDEEVDEEGFTAKEAEAYEKVLGRDHRIPLFRDISLADEATVDGGKGVVLGARPTSYRDMNHEDNGISPGLEFATLLEF